MWDKETKQLQGHLQKLEQEKFSLHKQTDAGMSCCMQNHVIFLTCSAYPGYELFFMLCVILNVPLNAD